MADDVLRKVLALRQNNFISKEQSNNKEERPDVLFQLFSKKYGNSSKENIASDSDQSAIRRTPTNNSSCGHYGRLTKGKREKNIRSKRKRLALESSVVKKDLEKECGCRMQCNTKFTPSDVMYWRLRIHSLSEGPERMTKIVEILKLASNSIGKNERNQQFRVNQTNCCRTFFINVILKISIATFTRAKRGLAENRTTMGDKSAPGQTTHAVRARICEGFVLEYMNASCDRDPTGKTYRMPAGLSRKDLHSLYKTVHKDGLEKSEFYLILQKQFDYLVFSKNQRFTKCTPCHDYRVLIEQEQDPQSKANWIAQRNLHLEEQRMEREAYYTRRAQAEIRPNSVLSLILDGMDQSKTDLPHYTKWNNPNGAGAMKLKTHIVGSIAHGRGKYFFIDHRQFPHDTNLVLSCLMKVLRQEAKDETLPPTLYVQLDNTTKENKNRFFLGMMGYLVKMGYVLEVYISFLLVGHTHEDIDQCFSKISQKLKSCDALTMEELSTRIKESQTPVRMAKEIGTVWDIKSWLGDCVVPQDNVTFNQVYRIYSDETNYVRMVYQRLSSSDEWYPTSDEEPLELFKFNAIGEQKFPRGHPEVVVPHVDDEELKDLKRSLQKDFQRAQFSEETIRWWDHFVLHPVEETYEEWPVFKKTKPATVKSTLSPKELGVIEAYKKKREEFKKVRSRVSRLTT